MVDPFLGGPTAARRPSLLDDLLLDGALRGGAQAVDRPIGAISVGQRADFVVLHDDGQRDDAVLDHWLFSADNAAIRTVYRGGIPVVQQGRHRDRDAIVARYRRVLAGMDLANQTP